MKIHCSLATTSNLPLSNSPLPPTGPFTLAYRDLSLGQKNPHPFFYGKRRNHLVHEKFNYLSCKEIIFFLK
jgi:hypothetical protein